MPLPRYFRNTDRFVTWLRISLGLIFFWFGALKFLGYNPVADIVAGVSPPLAYGAGNTLLGAFEAVIGLLLLLNVYPVVVHVALLLHLAGTFLTFFTAPHLMFEPYFPVLTLAGEFVFKNVTLAAAGLVVLAYEQRKRSK
ncbi:MAG: hypothetical protein A3J48_01015 [Candidatus Doudnabacteria bacterium RIFCSPHIGHO2_02_FULL_46_11]|uniref:DoxX family protein n=1 Tax=Candidatus Doudnabacteria bacterium RIFCSPHIGHO2_02_FULL_46_11 TaxID=1817832 RepID=A0A1F5P864_9BACT|nr:MAG: hypothetical protein A3J48_01015 [Candidatus Doudnabacteria bacterium RIFCSPHIGHO2_02_FULL_46_11]